MEIQENARSWSIGRLSELADMSVRTIRYYSDAGLLSEVRADSGHRRYGSGDLARLELIRSLRALDVSLEVIGDVVRGSGDLQQTLRAHAMTLQLRLKALRRQLAVSRAAAEAPSDRALARLHSLHRVEMAERDHLLSRFWDAVLDPGSAAPHAEELRQFGVPTLPEEPTGQQIDAWLELAALAADADFQKCTRDNAAWFGQHFRADLEVSAWQQRMRGAIAAAAAAHDADEPVQAPRVQAAIDQYCAAHAYAFDRRDDATFRRWLSGALIAHTDPRTARWWHLVSVLVSGQHGPAASSPAPIQWLHEALRASLASHPMHEMTPGPIAR